MKTFRWLAQLASMVTLTTSLWSSAAAQTAAATLPQDWAPVQLAHTASFELQSQHTGQRYRIWLGLPHRAAPAAGYPVLWVLDGHAAMPIMEFVRPRPPAPTDNARWRQRVGETPTGLIVAIGYASDTPMDVDGRAKDYTPPTQAPTGDQFSASHGGAEAFLRFMTEELRPLLAQHFPMDAKRHTLFGFSYGGLFTLHTLSTGSKHFQRYWAASPSLWYGQGEELRTLSRQLPALRTHTGAPLQLVLTVGLEEQFPTVALPPERQKHLQERAMVDRIREFARVLKEGAPQTVQVSEQVLPAHDHHDMLLHGARRVVDFAFAP